VAEESFSNIRIVRAFSSEQFEKKNYEQEVWAAFALAKKRAYSISVFSVSILVPASNIVYLHVVNTGSVFVSCKFGHLRSVVVWKQNGGGQRANCRYDNVDYIIWYCDYDII